MGSCLASLNSDRLLWQPQTLCLLSMASPGSASLRFERGLCCCSLCPHAPGGIHHVCSKGTSTWSICQEIQEFVKVDQILASGYELGSCHIYKTVVYDTKHHWLVACMCFQAITAATKASPVWLNLTRLVAWWWRQPHHRMSLWPAENAVSLLLVWVTTCMLLREVTAYSTDNSLIQWGSPLLAPTRRHVCLEFIL